MTHAFSFLLKCISASMSSHLQGLNLTHDKPAMGLTRDGEPVAVCSLNAITVKIFRLMWQLDLASAGCAENFSQPSQALPF